MVRHDTNPATQLAHLGHARLVQEFGERLGLREHSEMMPHPGPTMPSVLVWMDLEMTGLDHTSDVIVEIATLITDDDLNIVAEGPDLVVQASDEALAAMDPFVGRHAHPLGSPRPDHIV